MTKRVAVVGAGFTGLTAAYRLAQAGFDVEVFEAGAEVGGLAAGFELGGQPIEKAYHFLYKTDEHMLGLLEELGLSDRLTYHPSSVSTYYDDHLYPMNSPVDLLKFSPLSPLNRLRAGVTLLGIGRIKKWQKLTNVTAIEWLRKYAGNQVTDVVWEPLLKGKFDRYYDQVTMGWLWGRVKQRVETREPGQTGEALGYLDGGFRVVTDELSSQAEKLGARIRLNTPIETLTPQADGSVELTVDGQSESFDQVVLTVSSAVAAKLLATAGDQADAYIKGLSEIDYLDAAVMAFSSRQKITPYYWHNINTPDSPFVVFLSLTALVGSERFDGQHIYYIGDYIPREHWYMQAPAAEVETKWFEELGRIFPDFDPDALIEHQLFRFKDAQHIVDVGFDKKIPDHKTPIDGVYLANFSQIYPMDRGTNFAVAEGSKIAELVASAAE